MRYFLSSKIIGIVILLLITAAIPLTVFISHQQQDTRQRAASTSTVPNGFQEITVASGISSPTSMEFAPDGRLFIAEQGGKLRVVKNGQLLATPFVTLPVDSSGERGLLGIAFDPNFQTNNFMYLYYTTTPSGTNRISRFTANGDVAVENSEVILWDLDPHSAGNHNGGAIHFGKDGKLYVATGDNANGSNAQKVDTLHGKILRVNAVPDDPSTSTDERIPSDNPASFDTSNGVLTPTGRNKAIYLLGLRNPFTFDIQPGTGKMFINDVGDNGPIRWEEINEVSKPAENFGWPVAYGMEGSSDARYTRPIYTYQDGGCAITGGVFYNPSVHNFPSDYEGDYFFGDYCGNWIKRLKPLNNNAVSDFATNVSSPVDLKIGPEGALYYISYHDGTVHKIINSSAPTPSSTPVPTLPNGSAPTGSITSPPQGITYAAGDTIQYAGTGTDPEDGTLPASAFSWTIMFHHDTHTHPFLGPINNTKSGSFQIPKTGEPAANVWYRIYLTVTDSTGLKHESTRDINPRKSTITLASNPSGLQLTIDGQPKTTPYSVEGVVGFTRALGANSNQTLNGKTYQFVSWSDNGTQTHSVDTPNNNTTYTATFQEGPITGIPEDIDRDGCVGILDFNAWFQAVKGTPRANTFPDVNKDGIVDILDFNLWFRAIISLPPDKLC